MLSSSTSPQRRLTLSPSPIGAAALQPGESVVDLAVPIPALRVLIVEDDPQILEGVVRRLEAAGYATTIASDGFEAARLTVENPPQAIVLDIRLPRCDGMRFLDWIHESTFGHTIPVVVLSASLRARSRALAAGARFFLCKPYDGHTLLAAIHRAITDLVAERVETPKAEQDAPNAN
jgi:DNA-binding response OmpR family regulator